MTDNEIKPAIGRPSTYNLDIVNEICSRIADGMSLKTICKDPKMPDKATFYRWMDQYPELCDKYARAKEDSADALVDEMLYLADESNDVIVGDDKSDSARVNAKKLQVETRKWISSKLKPKKYGEKLDLTSDGKRIELPAIISTIQPRNVEPQG